jgi:hypothetical protein
VGLVLRRAVDSIDHLILGAATLADGIAFVRDRFGVAALPIVPLPGAATETARVALGPRSYLEVLAPADDADEPAPGLAPLRSLTTPALWGWALATDDGGIARDGGAFVRRRNLAVQVALGLAAPYFIEWGADSAHPAAAAPIGGRLRALTVRHPDPDAARAAIAKLGFDVDVVRADAPGLAAELETLAGARVTLT